MRFQLVQESSHRRQRSVEKQEEGGSYVDDGDVHRDIRGCIWAKVEIQ